MARAASLDKAFPSQEYSDVGRKDDPRLCHLAESGIGNRDEIRADHRRIRQAEIVFTEEEEKRQEGFDTEEDDKEALEERRRRIREKLLQREQKEAALLPEEEEEAVEEEDEEESKYETDSEEEQMGIAMLKPVFVPKSERDTIAERECLEAEERALEELSKWLRRSATMKKFRRIWKWSIILLMYTEVEEYEAWKVREIARINRDREAREAMLKEKEEIDKVRNMTEEEKREWERKNPKPAPPLKQKWRFMQKYCHKGVFFQSETG